MLFTLLMTVWGNDIGETHVVDYAMTGEECTNAIIEYVTESPTMPLGVPSCEIDHASLPAIFYHEGQEITLPACQQEDGYNCYWDAGVNGNGLGRSFYDVQGVSYTFQP